MRIGVMVFFVLKTQRFNGKLTRRTAPEYSRFHKSECPARSDAVPCYSKIDDLYVTLYF
jgi:hypothetical protein